MSRKNVSARLALRVARALGASFDDLVAGQFLPGACPRCGYVPDFADEETVVEGGPPPTPSGALKLVK